TLKPVAASFSCFSRFRLGRAFDFGFCFGPAVRSSRNRFFCRSNNFSWVHQFLPLSSFSNTDLPAPPKLSYALARGDALSCLGLGTSSRSPVHTSGLPAFRSPALNARSR